MQFAILYRHGERAPMSTRSGEFVTLRELRQEVGNDACRFFYVMRKSEQHLDFDLDLAKSQSKDNPVYYIQYAHARVSTVLAGEGRRSAARGGEADLAFSWSPNVNSPCCAPRRVPRKWSKQAALDHAPHAA